jgi:virulence-associated protein VapD
MEILGEKMDEKETKYHKDMSEMIDKLENMNKSINPNDRKQLEEFVQCVVEIRKRMEERKKDILEIITGL